MRFASSKVGRTKIDEIIKILKFVTRKFKEPALEATSRKFSSPFQILISCILSLRTKDEVTREASYRLFSIAKTPRAILQIPIHILRKTIYPVGFYRKKAKTIKSISQKLIEEYKGKVPDTIEELLKFNGVGRKTANLVVSLGFGKPGICVDTHVHRISNRWGYVKTATPYDTEFALRKKLPRKYWKEINELLVTFGQNICKPISPFCSKCDMFRYCKRAGVKVSR